MKIKSLIQITSAAAIFPLAVSAATVVWDGSTSTDFEVGTNWGGDAAPTNDTSTDIAQLIGGTVDVSVSRSVASLDLINSATTLTGTGTQLTLGGGLSGDQDLTLGGTATLELNGTNTSYGYTGDIYINTGATLRSGRNSLKLAADDPGTIITLDGGTISQTNDHLDLAGRDIVLGSGGGTLVHVHNKNIFGGYVISGAGQLTLRGANSNSGRVQLTETNTYTGGTLITDGAQAWMYNGSSFGTGDITFDNGDLVMVNNSTLDNDIIVNAGGAEFKGNNRRVTLAGSVSGSGDIAVTSGTVQINSSGNTYSGNATIDGATLAIGTGSAGFLGTGTITLDNGGKISGNGNHVNTSGLGGIIIGEGGGTLQNGNGRAYYGGGVISGTGLLTLDGAGYTNYGGNSRIQLSEADNSYTGGTLITNSANVQVSSNAALGADDTKVTIDNGRFVTVNNADFGAREFEIASGGARISLNAKSATIGGPITGTGDLLIDGYERDGDTGNKGGTFRVTTTGTNSGNVSIDGVDIQMDSNNAFGTGSITLDNGAQLKNRDSHTVLDNSIVIASGGGEFMAGWNKSLTINGDISGTGALTIISDSGDVILNGTNSLTGATSVEAGGTFGGAGSLAGDLSLAAGAFFIFSETDTLTVTGSVTLDSTFGADDLVGLSAATAFGTYVLIDGTVTDFSHIENFGAENAYDLGGGMSAYFQNGSLELVVVPEHSTFALLAGMLALGSVMIRRRR